MDVKVPLSQLSLASVLETCHDSGVSSEYGPSRMELGEQGGQEGHGAPGQDAEQPQYLDLEAGLHAQPNPSVHAQYGPYSSSFAGSQSQVSDNGLDYQSGAGYGPLGSFSNMDMEAAGLTPFRGYGSYPSTFNYVISPMQQQQEQSQHQAGNYYFGDSGLPVLSHGDSGLDGGKGFYHSQGSYGGDGGPHFAAMEHFGSPTSWSGTPGGPTHYAAASSQLLYGDQHCHFNRNWNALGGEGTGAGPGSGGSGEGAYGGLGTPQGSGSAKEGAGKRRSHGSTPAACPQPSASGSRLGRPRGTQRRGMKRTPSNSEEGSSGAPEPPTTPSPPPARPPSVPREALMNIQTLKPRDIVSWYIDHLINENEAITEMSQSFTIPMNLFETDETYFIDSLAKKMTFPTRKFLNWMSTELPSLNPHAIDFTEGKQGTVTPPDWNPEGKSKAEIVQQTFYSFQERRNRIREQKRNREHC